MLASTGAVVAAAAGAAPDLEEVHAIAQVRHEQRALEAAITAALLASARDTRRDAALSTGLVDEVSSVRAARFEIILQDEAASAAASATFSGAWAATVLATIASAAAGAVAGDVAREVPKQVAPRAVRTAATETAGVFNGEREDIYSDLAPGAFKVWCGILDGRICDRCFRLDGTVVPVKSSFPGGSPPLHPHCRCLVEHLIIPKPERLEDTAIDYEAFKAEVRDLIREGHEEGFGRPARAFIAESQGKDRSAVVLTRRFASRDFNPEAPVAINGGGKSPRLPPAPPPPRPPPPLAGGGGSGGGGGGGGPRKTLTFQPHLTADTVEALGATAHGPIESVTKALFAGKCPDAEGWRRLWEVPDGYALQLDRFSASGGHLTVTGRIVTSDGRKVGDVTRTFHRSDGELVVHHDFFKLSELHQGKGVSRVLTRSALLGYREMGVGLVEVDAHWVGRYTWASYGFSWPPSEGERWRRRLQNYLARELGDPAKAAALSVRALAGAPAVAQLEVEGKQLGKAFLMNDDHVPHWSGTLKLQDGDVGYEVARKRLNL